MNWTKIWMDLFGTNTLFGVDMGFWVSLFVVFLAVVFMNAAVWSVKPKKKTDSEKHKESQTENL